MLNRIDRVQRRFLRELGFNEKVALNDYRLAPLESRRDMAMLAMLDIVYNCVLGKGFAHFNEFSNWIQQGPPRRETAQEIGRYPE